MNALLTLCTAIGAMVVIGLTVAFVSMTVVTAGIALIEFICKLEKKRKGQR